jgi:hypothetical protein
LTGGVQLLEGMSALSDNERGQLELSNLVEGQVILAEMDAIGIASDRDVGAVVYYAQNIGVPAYLHKLDGDSKELVVGDIFRSQLDGVGAAGDAAVGQSDNIGRQVGADYHVQLNVFELFGGAAEENDILFECVADVAEIFYFLGYGRVYGLRHLSDGAQGFGEAFASGGEAVIQIVAAELAVDGFAGADVAEGVPAGDKPAGVESVDGGGKFMTELLGAFGQLSGIESEPAEFFYYAKGLTSPIKVGVNYSVSGVFHNEHDYTSRGW